MSRLLGVDLGTVRTGIAICDPNRKVASPLCVIEDPRIDGVAESIESLAEEWEVGEIVIGQPKMLSGKRGSLEDRVDALSAKLKGAGYNIVLHDERMTTKIAESALIGGDVSRRDRKSRVDKVAAAIMLQSYIDSHER